MSDIHQKDDPAGDTDSQTTLGHTSSNQSVSAAGTAGAGTGRERQGGQGVSAQLRKHFQFSGCPE